MRKKPSADLIWAILAIGITLAFLGAFKIIIVSGFSMAPTYHDGQVLLMKRSLGKLTYGDIVVIKQVEQGNVVKRVVGLPGDIIRLADGLVFRNDIGLSPYTSETMAPVIYILGEGEYFVIGDNFQASIDSRQLGPVKQDDLLGEIIPNKRMP